MKYYSCSEYYFQIESNSHAITMVNSLVEAWDGYIYSDRHKCGRANGEMLDAISSSLS
jgi:hypothetical protein